MIFDYKIKRFIVLWLKWKAEQYKSENDMRIWFNGSNNQNLNR